MELELWPLPQTTLTSTLRAWSPGAQASLCHFPSSRTHSRPLLRRPKGEACRRGQSGAARFLQLLPEGRVGCKWRGVQVAWSVKVKYAMKSSDFHVGQNPPLVQANVECASISCRFGVDHGFGWSMLAVCATMPSLRGCFFLLQMAYSSRDIAFKICIP